MCNCFRKPAKVFFFIIFEKFFSKLLYGKKKVLIFASAFAFKVGRSL